MRAPKEGALDDGDICGCEVDGERRDKRPEDIEEVRLWRRRTGGRCNDEVISMLPPPIEVRRNDDRK